MTDWNLIDEHTHDGFTIKTYTAPETDDPRDHFLIEGDAQMGLNESLYSVVEDIEAGNLAWFQVKVEASKLGYVLGETWLGGCCYQSEEAFLDGQCWRDMCLDAVTEARNALKELMEEEQ